MYSADADGRGRTRTDADIYFIFYFFIFIFFCIHRATGPIGARPRVRPLGSPPPFPTHHDHMKIYIVYWLSLLFIFFLTLRCILCIPRGEGGGTPYIFHMHMCRQNAPLFDDFSLAGHLKNGHLLSICPTNSQASQIIIDQ